jgi:uncharacterized protein (DUF1778 family)
MGSTTFHIPDDFLQRIDYAARAKGVSRNRFVLQACTDALDRQAGTWPEEFFDLRFAPEDERLLREAAVEMEREVLSRRSNRGAAAL